VVLPCISGGVVRKKCEATTARPTRARLPGVVSVEIVRAATSKRPLGLIVLGGWHDLSESVRRVGGGRCDYVRVRMSRVKEFSGETAR
jgi:hypothetical protein